MSELRIGLGYDVHAFADGRRARARRRRGAVRHAAWRGTRTPTCSCTRSWTPSSARCALGDIGQHFPDTDARWRDADSLDLLRRVGGIMREQRLVRSSTPTACSCSRSRRSSPYRDEMRRAMAAALGVDVERIGLKATTTEGLGFAGRGEGVAAQAVVLLEWRLR